MSFKILAEGERHSYTWIYKLKTKMILPDLTMTTYLRKSHAIKCHKWKGTKQGESNYGLTRKLNAIIEK